VCVYHVVYYQQLHAGLPASGQQASVLQASGPQAHPTASEPEAPSQPQAASGPPRPSHWQPQLRLRLGVTGSGSSIWIQHNTLMARKHVERGLIFFNYFKPSMSKHATVSTTPLERLRSWGGRLRYTQT